MPGLGFGCRTAREQWRAGGVVVVADKDAADVGPGAYNVAGRAPEKCQAPAPFLTTAKRTFDTRPTTDEVPPPGAYEVHRAEAVLAGRHVPPGVPSAFKSGTKRFGALEVGESAAVPGPGTYLTNTSTMRRAVGPKFGKDAAKAAAEAAASSKWSRIPSAPSIPVREQAYGYEESAGGVLIAQRAAVPGHTGCAGDTPGPMDYRPKLNATRPALGKGVVAFARGADRMVALERAQRAVTGGGGGGGGGGTAPGPGYYNSRPGIGGDGAAARQARARPRRRASAAAAMAGFGGPAAAAAAAAARRRAEEATRAPGPTTYSVQGGMAALAAEAARKTAARDQSFLSTAARFAHERNAAAEVPGPGAYCIDQGSRAAAAGGRARAARLSRSHTAPVGFASTAQRFGAGSAICAPAGATEVGPGAYHLPGVMEEAQRKWEKERARGGGGGAGFGSSARRFPVSAAAAESVDGEEGAAAAAAVASVAGGSTLSVTDGHGGGATGAQSKAAAAAARRRVMPGGARACSAAALAAPRHPSSSFASGVRRFSTGAAAAAPASAEGDVIGPDSSPLPAHRASGPGPGTYNVSRPLDSGGRGVVPMARSTEVRFRPQRTDCEVGPGAYDTARADGAGWRGGRRGLLASGEKRGGWMGVPAATPGPGAYNATLLHGNMIKPTFNVCVAEMSAQVM